ncbi:transporter substrate-binding domain-containing protein [Naumannella halotolerans]|uniref:Cyclohexadienyl dehydratase n=1 Tax=Naumannella halotolerans TaxID=993414 RepID=A0A4R7J9Y8_9ACTN|nr:transporter substrate-binding domain-containing protein [Naumannella halotolerans]TDT34371.1 cyclohexadienyl dehydratase [Naumannella halotolerans]
MRRITRTAPFVLFGIMAMGACTAPVPPAVTEQPSTEPEGTLAEVRSADTLRVCTTGDYRPYTYRDPETGSWSGIDLDLAEDLAETLDVERELVQVSWSELVGSITDGDCDIAMGGISFNDERDQQVDFSEPTVEDGKAPITTCESAERFQTIEDINQPGVRVITPVGGTNEAFADENFADAEIIKWDDNNTIFDQIVDGEADVMVTDASETKWVAHEHEGVLCAVNPDQPFTSFENGYLLPEDDPEWRDTVDAWLTEAQSDGTYAEAEEPWFG